MMIIMVPALAKCSNSLSEFVKTDECCLNETKHLKSNLLCMLKERQRPLKSFSMGLILTAKGHVAAKFVNLGVFDHHLRGK